MKKNAMIEVKSQEDPAVLLEKIMQAEVKSSDRIAGAKKDAERRIAIVQEEAANSRKEAYASGRRARTRLVENGIAKTKIAAEEKLHLSESETSKIIENGKQLIPEAVAISLGFILDRRSKEGSHDSQNGKN
jgi:vacuolar-type H+-ATPase subunit H